MNIQLFFKQWNGKYNQFPDIPNQCVCIVKQYFQDVLNIIPKKGNAIDYWNNPPQDFQVVKNSPFNWPQPGDLIIWSIGQYGHIGICNWSNVFSFNCFEQNNPIGSPCHFGTHSYKQVLGWLHPKNVI